MKLGDKLQSLLKNGLSILDYMLRVKIMSDHLVVVGEFISKREMVLHILNYLGPRYLTFITIFNMSQIKPYVGVLHNQLEIFEIILVSSEENVQESSF